MEVIAVSTTIARGRSSFSQLGHPKNSRLQSQDAPHNQLSRKGGVLPCVQVNELSRLLYLNRANFRRAGVHYYPTDITTRKPWVARPRSVRSWFQ